MQAMLFAMLQDQHTKQITHMKATNKANMEAMMEKMNALMASNTTRQMHQLDKENTPLGGNVNPPAAAAAAASKQRSPKRKRRYAPTVTVLRCTSPSYAMNWRQTKPGATRDGSPSLRRHQPLDSYWGQQ